MKANEIKANEEIIVEDGNEDGLMKSLQKSNWKNKIIVFGMIVLVGGLLGMISGGVYDIITPDPWYVRLFTW